MRFLISSGSQQRTPEKPYLIPTGTYTAKCQQPKIIINYKLLLLSGGIFGKHFLVKNTVQAYRTHLMR
jgi:hypothetical protein